MTDQQTDCLPDPEPVKRILAVRGEPDDITITDVTMARLERMDRGYWYLGLYQGDRRLSLFLHSQRRITARISEDELECDLEAIEEHGVAHGPDSEGWLALEAEQPHRLTLDNLRRWHIEQADYWTDVATDHKEQRDFDKFNDVMKHAGFHRYLARMIQEGFLPDED